MQSHPQENVILPTDGGGGEPKRSQHLGNVITALYISAMLHFDGHTRFS